MKRISLILIAVLLALNTSEAIADQSQINELMGLGVPGITAAKFDELYRTAIPTEMTYNAGFNDRLSAYVPTLAATPVAGTNLFKPGLNVIPTNAASNAGFLGAATPVVGQQFRIINNSGAAQFIKASGGATLNGAQAGGKISIASLAIVDCITMSTGNQVCEQPVVPTPSAP
jgi:hypothetical protein